MASYQIDSAEDRKSSPRMSAFPKRTRPFTEPRTATEDEVLGPNLTLPEIARKFYPGAVPHAFSARFGFLDRDNKKRAYEPRVADRFVFNGGGSLKKFSESAYNLIALLCDEWTKLGLPLVFDKDRECDVPDSSVFDGGGKSAEAAREVFRTHQGTVQFILSNVDIMKKACVVRSINHGWWVVSYAGRNATNLAYFKTSLEAHRRAIHAIIRSNAGKEKYREFWADAGDPILTNPGYPYFNAEVDADGSPVTRIKTVELFSDVVRLAGGSWKRTLELVDERAGALGLKGFPFAVAPLRRLQPGYKWQHMFSLTGSGLRSAYDERGVNSQRVAHMVPYAYNVITSPVSTLYKTVRYFLPGCYHDGEGKKQRMHRLSDDDRKGKLWLMEADYSNFDRFMPVDLIEKIIAMFTDVLDNSSYWWDAMSYLHNDATLLWPDYSIAGSGRGWAFKPGRLGLLSGVKATSETGTLVNSVVNGEALARLKGWTVDELTQYLTQYVEAERPGSSKEYYYVQSDDTMLIADDIGTLLKHGNLFREAVKNAGIKGSTEYADRFLMRHLQGGRDAPVPARVWQNTLSNEVPPERETIFLAGLAARTDGLFGAKSVDPFGTGRTQEITNAEREFTLAVVRNLRQFLDTAASRSIVGVRLIDLLLSMGEKMTKTARGGWVARGSDLTALTSLRNAITKALADEQVALLEARPQLAGETWLYGLYRDRHSPTAASVLDELLSQSGAIKTTMDKIGKKEHAFFAYACKTIGVKPLNSMY